MSERLARGLLDTSVIVDRVHGRPVAGGDCHLGHYPRGTVRWSNGDQGPCGTSAKSGSPATHRGSFRSSAIRGRGGRAYGLVHAAVVERGRQPRRRFADLFIAAIPVAEQLPLLTRNAGDFLGLDRLILLLRSEGDEGRCALEMRSENPAVERSRVHRASLRRRIV